MLVPLYQVFHDEVFFVLGKVRLTTPLGEDVIVECGLELRRVRNLGDGAPKVGHMPTQRARSCEQRHERVVKEIRSGDCQKKKRGNRKIKS